ncbi:MAG: DUF4956 domain-containing protein [Chloroflexi bacterium]|nr:MAG: DUF4956 domain-containing protein [Chloroflexota bacterium]
MDNIFGLTNPAPLSLTTLAVNLLLSIILSSALAWYYTKYGKSLSNRANFAQMLPLLTMTTVLIISVVKSSLALSLGLVGALSIVRFRTAIKEPEELIYLFMAISIGLGMGADQRLPTLLAIAVILVYLVFRTILTRQPRPSNLYLNIATAHGEHTFARIKGILFKHVSTADLRRLDNDAAMLQATFLIACPDDDALVALMDELREQLPTCECSFVAQDTTLGG